MSTDTASVEALAAGIWPFAPGLDNKLSRAAAMLRSLAAERDTLKAALDAAQAAAQAPRTPLEQYDLDHSPEYRKGYEDGRLKGYEVGHRHAQEAAQAPREAPRLTDGDLAELHRAWIAGRTFLFRPLVLAVEARVRELCGVAP